MKQIWRQSKSPFKSSLEQLQVHDDNDRWCSKLERWLICLDHPLMTPYLQTNWWASRNYQCCATPSWWLGSLRAQSKNLKITYFLLKRVDQHTLNGSVPFKSCRKFSNIRTSRFLASPSLFESFFTQKEILRGWAIYQVPCREQSQQSIETNITGID